MFLALRDLRFARGRTALIGAVVAMIAVLGVILSGLASGLADAGVSSLRALPATHMAFDKSASTKMFSDELLEAVGMTGRAGSRPHQLSGGERQRVGLARALVLAPDILLVDEPTSALDRARARDIVELLAEQTRVHRTATVMVTHDTEILDAADHVLTLRDGRLT
ncbi:ATP-binding cassette domain-containing protein [Streptomyces sp. NPDC048720]|uniref:ATP-binding cassette domain-containing protein n=1 Tax=Streptomyces sp. NPDC048720 TaxID=3365588 RepID=UPI0037205390